MHTAFEARGTRRSVQAGDVQAALLINYTNVRDIKLVINRLVKIYPLSIAQKLCAPDQCYLATARCGGSAGVRCVREAKCKNELAFFVLPLVVSMANTVRVCEYKYRDPCTSGTWNEAPQKNIYSTACANVREQSRLANTGAESRRSINFDLQIIEKWAEILMAHQESFSVISPSSSIWR